MKSTVKIGWAEVSLVPEGRTVNLAGQFYERITDRVETPITATALAMECGGDAAILCSCDLESVSYALLSDVRARLGEVEGLPVDAVMLNAIHTHTSIAYSKDIGKKSAVSSLTVLEKLVPDAKYEKLVTYSGDDLLTGEEAHDFLARRIAEAVRAAWESRAEGGYAPGFGRAAVGMCRRVCYTDGSAKMWGDTDTATFTELEGGSDSGIELLYTYTADRRLSGIVANVACPAQVLEHRSFISSDYVGKVKARLRAKLGEDIHLLALIAPAGDQCPRDLVRWVEPETPINDPNIERIDPTVRRADPSMFDIKGCERIARRISDEILYTLEDITDGDIIYKAEFGHRRFVLDMPLRRVSPSEADAAAAAIREFVRENEGRPITFRDNARMHVHAGTILRRQVQETVDVMPIEVHVIRLGDIALATNPYELFLDFGNRIRARSHAAQTFLVQLCCGAYGYLPTEKAERGSHYSAYVSSGYAGHEGGDLLVRKTVSEINAMLED